MESPFHRLVFHRLPLCTAAHFGGSVPSTFGSPTFNLAFGDEIANRGR